MIGQIRSCVIPTRTLRITISITGAGTVLYAGNPTIEQQITGTGSVRKLA